MSLTFHRTFSFSRSSISMIIRLAYEDPLYKQSDLANKTSLGTIYQEAMPRYAYRAGLLNEKHRLTAFGNVVAQYDPHMERLSTQWLLHYHLAAPHRPTAFWHFFVTKFFIPGNSFSASELTYGLEDFLLRQSGKKLAPKSVRSTVTAFTGTYLKSDGLNRLGILEESAKETYYVSTVSPPPVWALGYALVDYWQAHFGARLTVNLDDLVRDFAVLFLLGENGFTELLLKLKQEGLLDLYRISRPYQVVLLQPNTQFALDKIYA
ncbi:MAG: DUF4007 family protein [Anaerolineales bacterium]